MLSWSSVSFPAIDRVRHYLPINVLLEGYSGLVLVVNVKQDDTLGTALRDVLVLPLLGVGQVVVLVKEGTRIDGVSFLTSGLDDTNAASSNVLESQVKATELGSDD